VSSYAAEEPNEEVAGEELGGEEGLGDGELGVTCEGGEGERGPEAEVGGEEESAAVAEEEGFWRWTERLRARAARACGGRLISSECA